MFKRTRFELIITFFIYALLICKPGYADARCSQDGNKLLLISFDGFRWDYIHKANNLTAFHRMISDGAWAVKGIKNTFLTKTIPNHYTIVTGLYEESHGMVGNVMYDPVLNRTFHAWIDSDIRDSAWWDNGGEPIWVTYQRQLSCGRSGVMGWPGGLARVKGFYPYRAEPWMDVFTNQTKERVDKLLEWFTDDYPIELGLFYHNEPDDVGHKFGPDSNEVLSKIIELDSLMDYLLNKLEDLGLLNKMNIIVTSDHGMTTLPDDRQYKIDLNDYIRFDSYFVTSTNPVAAIFPKSKELEDEIFKNLTRIPHTKVYHRGDIPQEYHYTNNRRIPPIILEPEEHYWVSYNNSGHINGEHGYNNSLSSMHPFFIAMGPDFKPGAKVDTFNNVDIYPLMCRLLGLNPAPNNGSLYVVSKLLKQSLEEEASSFAFTAYLMIIVFVGLVSGIFSVAVCHLQRQHKRRLHALPTYSLPLSLRNSAPERKALLSDSKPLMSETSDDELDIEDELDIH